MNILMIDLETTGLNPDDSRIWEIGAVLVDPNWNVLGKFTARIWDDEIERQLIDREDVLPNLPALGLIRASAMAPDVAYSLLNDFIPSDLQYAVAYNKSFDEVFFKHEVSKLSYSMHPNINLLTQVPWLCAMREVETHAKFKCWKLGHLALDYGIAVDPSKLHGALEDIELTAQLMRKTGQTFGDVLAYASVPSIIVRGVTNPPWEDGGKSNDAAKAMGYTWQKVRDYDKTFEKCWVKKIKANKLDEEHEAATKAGFSVRKIEEVL